MTFRQVYRVDSLWNAYVTWQYYTDCWTNPPEKTFFLRPTTPDETEDIDKTLSVGKPLGPNSIHTKLIYKQFSKSISIPLSSLINLSFKNNGVFPNAVKLASVIPVFKEGDYLRCNNYRSISLTLNISKITKKLVHQWLYLFLEQNNVL